MRPPDPCSATTRAGTPCQFAARRASGLCINHDPAYKEQQRANSARGVAASLASRRAQHHQISLDEFRLTNRESIQATLDAVVRLELTGRIPVTRSRNLIRLLGIASRNFNRDLYNRTSLDSQHYDRARQRLDLRLESLCREADTRDEARAKDARR